ncbi:NAD(P)H-dependent oxidoreductase [Marinifilum fragile]|uniref:FMN-dependent NADH-azoreductase n=1 Tax=Marinifilum fragile TaxID=570161 RepID=UPI002AA83DA2|nr:NAD(P)H-dependent oxidoreductase [Marinifilum fragile]
MNILIVKYLPSGSKSNTLGLLNHFLENLSTTHNITEVDLVKSPPKYFDELTLGAYTKKNFGGMQLDSIESEAIKPIDALNEQFINADLVLLALPMHNFSLPGIVKVYLDAIMQSGKVFKYENGAPVGLMNKMKFVTLYTSAGKYLGDYEFLDNVKTLLKIELDFMGIKDYDFVHASSGNPDTFESEFTNAKQQIDQIIQSWNL